MGRIGKLFGDRFMKDKLKSWDNGGEYRAVEMIMFMHFHNRLLNCENCEDYMVRVCPGRGLKGYQEIKKCMESKAVNFEYVAGSRK